VTVDSSVIGLGIILLVDDHSPSANRRLFSSASVTQGTASKLRDKKGPAVYRSKSYFTVSSPFGMRYRVSCQELGICSALVNPPAEQSENQAFEGPSEMLVCVPKGFYLWRIQVVPMYDWRVAQPFHVNSTAGAPPSSPAFRDMGSDKPCIIAYRHDLHIGRPSKRTKLTSVLNLARGCFAAFNSEKTSKTVHHDRPIPSALFFQILGNGNCENLRPLSHASVTHDRDTSSKNRDHHHGELCLGEGSSRFEKFAGEETLTARAEQARRIILSPCE
jgi:hypothetical protein